MIMWPMIVGTQPIDLADRWILRPLRMITTRVVTGDNVTYMLWLTRMTVRPSAFRVTDQVEDLRRLAHAESRGRFVHDDDLGIPAQRARYCDGLALATGQAFHRAAGVGDLH